MRLNIYRKYILLGWLLTQCTLGFAQHKFTIKGKVIDSETGEGMPFVNVYFPGSQKGVSTNFDGYFELHSDYLGDSLAASSVGYIIKVKALSKDFVQVVNFQLMSSATTLRTVEVSSKGYENPAWEILRNSIKNKPKNDKRRLSAYEHDSYTKVEIDVDNITDKFREKRLVKKITNVLDSIQQIAGEDGQPILPIFISETISKIYYKENPQRKREDILKTKVSGIGVTDGSTISQILGASFQEYNFYKNWMRIVEKDFASPLAESWRLIYDYDLLSYDEKIGGLTCYKIAFEPKRDEDLAFKGTMWITDSLNHYALKQIEVTVSKEANLNFVEKIKIQQELSQTKEGAWLPQKTRVIIDIGEVRDDWAGMLAKFYVSNKDFVVNQPYEGSFYEQEIVLDEMALVSDDDYWKEARHDPLSDSELNVYHMIDTMKNLPAVKSYVDIANFVINGYQKVGMIDIGPYLYAYNHNEIEGHRLQLGMRTNIDFSRKFILKGYGAYGFGDERFKYKAEVNYIASRRPWTVFGISRSEDIDQVGIFNENLNNTALFNAFNSFGILRQPFLHPMNKAWVHTEVIPGLQQRLTFRHRSFLPLYNFEYFKSGNDLQRESEFTLSELIFEARLAIGERFIQNDNSRISLGNGSRPVFTLRYTYGMDGVLNSDFGYHRFDGGISQSFRLGSLGRFNYSLQGGYVPSTVPYPLLETHLGNESFFLNTVSFNMMDFFEFVSDKYTSLSVMHRFEGLILNRIPLMRKLNWRLFVQGKMLWGSLRQDNIDIIPETDTMGIPIPGPNNLGIEPYTEIGYGIENIFRILRIDFLHRLNYLDPGTSDFAVKFSTQFRL